MFYTLKIVDIKMLRHFSLHYALRVGLLMALSFLVRYERLIQYAVLYLLVSYNDYHNAEICQFISVI